MLSGSVFSKEGALEGPMEAFPFPTLFEGRQYSVGNQGLGYGLRTNLLAFALKGEMAWRSVKGYHVRDGSGYVAADRSVFITGR